MIQLKKVAVSILATLALTACGLEASQSASATSKTLKDNGYTVSVYSAEQYATLQIASKFKETDGLKDHLLAAKGQEYFLVTWFFDSIGNADKFSKKYQTELLGLLNDSSTDSMGQKDNAVWVGSKVTSNLLGWSSYVLD